jgi:hypothetical protein
MENEDDSGVEEIIEEIYEDDDGEEVEDDNSGDVVICNYVKKK